jgi:segregation and condensation protein B
VDKTEMREILEAVLFCADGPIRLSTLVEVLENGAGPAEVRGAIGELNEAYESDGRAFYIEEIAGGFQFLTRPEFDEAVRRLQKTRARAKLSRAGLETLAIIAYHQPVTRPQIEEIRGVDIGGVLGTLLERGLIRISGRSDHVGRPMLYATTPVFLEHFGLRNLSDLPSIEDISAALDRKEVAGDVARALGGEPDDFEVEIAAHLGPGNGHGTTDPEADDVVTGGIREEAPAGVPGDLG